MPILKVKVSQPASTDMTLAVSKTLLELTTRILHKKARAYVDCDRQCSA